jgi:coenzyme F420-dependent glucose-6-phosphate dehydrogenase
VTKLPHTFKFGYGIAVEQRSPTLCLQMASEAEKAGFDAVWFSDHFHPWFDTNASGGFAWVCIASAAERTKKVQFGTAITCPLFRYNPAIVAQAFATLGSMYPGRIFLTVGTGEAMNEVPVGYDWPTFPERIKRFEEAIRIIKLLWNQDWVTFKGQYYTLRKANLYTKPKQPIPLLVAGNGPKATELAGKYGDGFLTGLLPENYYENVLFPALKKGAQEAGRDYDSIEKAIELNVSYAEDYQKALDSIRCWAGTCFPAVFQYPISDPRIIESYANLVGDKQLAQAMIIGTTPEEHIKGIEKYIKLGFTNIHIASSSPDEAKTFTMYARKIIPYLKSAHAQ